MSSIEKPQSHLLSTNRNLYSLFIVTEKGIVSANFNWSGCCWKLLWAPFIDFKTQEDQFRPEWVQFNNRKQLKRTPTISSVCIHFFHSFHWNWFESLWKRNKCIDVTYLKKETCHFFSATQKRCLDQTITSGNLFKLNQKLKGRNQWPMRLR